MVARRAENKTESQIAKVKKQTIISVYSKDKSRTAEQWENDISQVAVLLAKTCKLLLSQVFLEVSNAFLKQGHRLIWELQQGLVKPNSLSHKKYTPGDKPA